MLGVHLRTPGRTAAASRRQLTGEVAGLRSARRGSYRIIYAVDEQLEQIDIIHRDHRGDVYR
jgi:mRNA-degrading endonuclease RelE of RelBE toxin-antitoxin system